MDRRNIVLTGFMGTGKTSVGHALAKLLGRKLIDMDTWIAAREGQTVAEIFAERGEADFRELERALILELVASENLVIATGGGALVNPENRAAFSDAQIICLDASVDEILARLNGANDRPLLQGDKETRIQELLDARRDAYNAIAMHVNTNQRTPQEIAQEIVNRLEMREILVETPHGAYPIFLGRCLLDHVGEFLRDHKFAARCAVVTNPTVGMLYAQRVLESLRAQNFSPTLIEIPDGEQYKTLDAVRDLYDQFIAAKLERRSPIFALGGGVIGDTVGFAAATYLRGVPFVQIPTTLLAMVDSSIGGKVAVDHPSGKNLIGAFKFPVCVIADLSVLETLPLEEFRAGMAEVIKHGVIGDAGLFEQIRETGKQGDRETGKQGDRETGKQGSREVSGELLERALRVKIEIVERDPFEENVRAHLNLGHTFGQAIEKLAEYKMRHGYAVAMGVCVAARLAANISLCDATTRDEIISLFEEFELPTHIPQEFSAEQILDAMGTDKKIQDGKLRLILPREVGCVVIMNDVRRGAMLKALAESY
ncbi:MAG: 3-dehydroquinate synthase [Chloroflexota bacterium]|nr:MAG: 3-dehydroquinate synthase [Chloroflexota bacterium]